MTHRYYKMELSNAGRITLILIALWFVLLIALGHYADATFVIGLIPFIAAIVWACDQWRRRYPKPQGISNEEETKRAAEAGRKIREAELEYQEKRAAKQQAKLMDVAMRGLEHHLGPEYQLKDGVLITEQGRRASFPGLSPPLFADVAKAESWLEANGQRGTVWSEEAHSHPSGAG